MPAIRRTIATRTHLLFEADQDVVILPRRAFAEEGALEDLARRVDGVPKAVPESPPAPTVDPAASA